MSPEQKAFRSQKTMEQMVDEEFEAMQGSMLDAA